MSIIYIPTKEMNTFQKTVYEHNLELLKKKGFRDLVGINGYFQYVKEKDKYNGFYLTIHSHQYTYTKWHSLNKVSKDVKPTKQLMDIIIGLQSILKEICIVGEWY